MTIDQAFQMAIHFQATGNASGAESLFRQILSKAPRHYSVMNSLGVLLMTCGKAEEGLILLRRAAKADPGNAYFANNLGLALEGSGQLEEAESQFRRAIELNPNFGAAYCGLGHALCQSGRVSQALPVFRQAVQAQPDYARGWDNLLFTLQFVPGMSAQEILDEHKRWHAEVASPLMGQDPLVTDRGADRRLKVGYLGGHFWAHCQALFLAPLLANHDHSAFEIHCYSTGSKCDEKTELFKSYADAWHDCLHLSDSQVAEQIRADRIDVLVDLSMHMAGGRSLIAAQRPAPVQVAWLAYPGTNGFGPEDFRLTDPYLDPPGSDETVYGESTIRLPDTFWCYDPQSELPIGDLPANADKLVTFGCLNNFAKVNEETLSLWRRFFDARGMRSRMLLMAAKGPHRNQVAKALGPNVEVKFVEYRPREEYLKTYGRIDICLDTFPYNGHTTSLDAYWMGVPVVTYASPNSRLVGRAGLSQLTNLGLQELCGSSEEEFIDIGVALSGDLPRLASLRRSLRERMLSSPLMDGPKFARGMEEALRTAWRTPTQNP